MTSYSKILLSVTDIYTGAWFAMDKDKPISNTGVKITVKMQQTFYRAVSKCKILLS